MASQFKPLRADLLEELIRLETHALRMVSSVHGYITEAEAVRLECVRRATGATWHPETGFKPYTESN